MKPLKSQSEAEILSFCRQAEEEYGRLKAKGLKLDMSRGKPASIQVDLSNGIFDLPADGNFVMDGIDVRNYGGVDGLPSCKKLFADLLGVSPEEVFVGVNESLQLM